MSNSLRSHGLQHARLACPSPTPGAYTDLCPSHRWCHPTISFSVNPFSSCLQSFPEPGSFQMSQFFPSGGQSIRVSASALVFQSYSGLIFFRMNWLDLLEVQGTLESLPQHHSSKASILQQSAFFIVQLLHPYTTTGAYSNSCPLSPWCHPTISSSVIPFFSRPQSFPASGLFQWVSSSNQVAKVLEFQL